MKRKILNILRTTDEVVSGETLSAELGTSRVTVWKHIRKLRELGYNIATTPKGYSLVDNGDLLHPWEFPGREATVHYFEETNSTMDVARDLARKGCPHLTVVIAGRQTKGRGRLTRTWISSDGGLYFTVVIRPELPMDLSFRINFVASVVLARLLQETYGIQAMVKWPNDILVGDKKISGMLSEMETVDEIVSFINMGIGINVNNDPTREEPKASSLKNILGKDISRKDLLSAFLDEFEKRIDQADYDDIITEWKQYTMTLNQHVRIVTIHDEFEGLAVDVDDSGALILEQADGSIKRVIYGDCFPV